MKKFLCIIFLMIFAVLDVSAKNIDYEQIYRDMEAPKVKYIL